MGSTSFGCDRKRMILYLLFLSWLLAGCLAAHEPDTSIDVSSPSITPTIEATSSATATPQPLVSTAEPAAVEGARAIQITEQEGLAGAKWADDGQSVIYALRSGDWWRYDVATGVHAPMQPPFRLDLRALGEKLGATSLSVSNFSADYLWFWGDISPSGEWIVYNRLPPGYDQTPTPEGFYLDPYQVWTARTDGSEARSLGYCYSVGYVIWLNEEQEIIFSCGYEGPADIRWAAVDGSREKDLSSDFGLLGPMALSPDESLLAFIDGVDRLQIAALDGSEIRLISRFGWGLSWSQDSRRLYYSYFEEWGADSADIHVYDWETGEDQEVVTSPVMTAEGKAVTIGGNASLAVSPLGNAAILESSGLWLVQWSP